MIKKALGLALVLALVAGVTVHLSAQSPPDDGTSIEATVLSLLELPPDERVAALKAMSPEERLGVWYAVKNAEAKERNHEPSHNYVERLNVASKRQAASAARSEAQVEKIVGMITYDANAGTTTFGGGAIIGNRFDTHTGIPVLTSGTVSAVQAVVAQGPAKTAMSNSAGFVIEGPQTVGGGAFAIFSTFTNGLTAVTTTLTYTGFAASYTGNSFFVLFGDFANGYVPVFGTSSNGQGHHGVVGYTGGMGPNITGTFDFGETRNGLVRATGNIVPVELMSFEVD